MPETKSRYQLERSDYTNHLTVVVNRQALQEGRQALRNSEKCIDKQHDDVIFTIYAPTGKDPNIVKILRAIAMNRSEILANSSKR